MITKRDRSTLKASYAPGGVMIAALAFVLALTFLAGPLLAQDNVQVTQVDPSAFPEMTLYVRVTDAAGQPVSGLMQDDFTVTEDGEAVEIIDFAGTTDARPVDIVFVFDTTGSMNEEISGVVERSIAFAERLQASNRDFRLGLVTFSDEILGVYGADGTLTANAEEFKSWVSSLWADGGGDDPEIALDGVQRGAAMGFREGTQKILILITDAPPHERGDGSPFSGVTHTQVLAGLLDQGFTVYAVAYDDPRYRSLAAQTSGDFYHLTSTIDFTSIIDDISAVIADQYRIVYHSPRPAYDGTRRNITVATTGGAAGESDYLEEHLLQIRASPLIAAILLAPLLLALVAPALIDRLRGSRPRGERDRQDVSQASASQPHPVALSPDRCPNCQQPIRIGAKFCAHCGHTLAAAPPSPVATAEWADQTKCIWCSQPLRPGAKFCGRCGRDQQLH